MSDTGTSGGNPQPVDAGRADPAGKQDGNRPFDGAAAQVEIRAMWRRIQNLEMEVMQRQFREAQLMEQFNDLGRLVRRLMNEVHIHG